MAEGIEPPYEQYLIEAQKSQRHGDVKKINLGLVKTIGCDGDISDGGSVEPANRRAPRKCMSGCVAPLLDTPSGQDHDARQP